MSLAAYIAAISAALTLRLHKPNRIGPGVKTTRIFRGRPRYTDINGAYKYDGAHPRAIRAKHGVGRPVAR